MASVLPASNTSMRSDRNTYVGWVILTFFLLTLTRWRFLGLYIKCSEDGSLQLCKFLKFRDHIVGKQFRIQSKNNANFLLSGIFFPQFLGEFSSSLRKWGNMSITSQLKKKKVGAKQFTKKHGKAEPTCLNEQIHSSAWNSVWSSVFNSKTMCCIWDIIKGASWYLRQI